MGQAGKSHSSDWSRVKRIFLEVCDLDPASLSGRLDELCGGDQELRQAVERLLQHDDPGSIFDSPGVDPQPATREELHPHSAAPVISDQWIGKTIQSYRLLEPIGKGGMGEVYRAEDIRLKRTVAVKFLGGRFLRDDHQKKRFLREAQAAAGLDHPSVCAVHDVGEFEGHPYIVTTYVQGESLADLLRSGSVSTRAAIDYAIQIGEGLQAAHRRGIFHRDMKPGNVMLSRGTSGNPQVKIIDFGLARISSSSDLTEPGQVVGTAAYIAPEILQGHPIDQRADIWSLGVMLYEMLTGQQPFDAESRERLFYLICTEEAPPLTAVRPNLPAMTERIVAKALEKDRESRYQNVGDLLADLGDLKNEFLSAEIALPRPERELATGEVQPRKSGVTATAKAVSRRWAAGLLSLVALMAVLALLWLRGDRESARQATAVPRIAVLPFEDLSLGESDQRVSRALEESLAIQLAGLSGVRVVSRSVVSDLQARRASTREIIRVLRLDYVVTGSVTRWGATFRTTVNLISGRDDTTLWSKAIAFQWTDVLQVQKEFSETFVHEMGAKIAAPTNDHAAASTSPDAYDSYMKARFSLAQFTNSGQPEFLRTAEERLKQALELDPSLVDAMVAMAELRLNQLYPPPSDRRFLVPDATRWLDRALSKDPANPAANSLMALAQSELGMSARGLRYARAAVASAPRNGLFHHRLSAVYSRLGFFESAMAENEKAIQLDSPSSEAWVSQIWHFTTLGRFGEAEAAINQLQSMDSRSIASTFYLARLEFHRGRYRNAGKLFEASGRVEGSAISKAGVEIGAALVRAALGETAVGREVLNKYVSSGPRGVDDVIMLAGIVGDAEAMVMLTKESPLFNNYRWVISRPFMNNLKDQEPFRKFLFDLHESWESVLKEEGQSLPVRPPNLLNPQEFLAASR